MELDKATALMRKMSEAGDTHEAIAAELKKRGFKGPRSGKPIPASQVGYYLRKDTEAKADGAANGITATSPTIPPEARIAMAIKILETAEWAADQRCTIALTMLKG
jgi:hypothetical protein